MLPLRVAFLTPFTVILFHTVFWFFSLCLSRGTVIFLIYLLIGGKLVYNVVLVSTVLDVSCLSEKAEVLSVGTAHGNLMSC